MSDDQVDERERVVSVLDYLPRSERLGTCNCCGKRSPHALQVRVIGHHIALCGPCVAWMLIQWLEQLPGGEEAGQP